ncbi:hypothetical protein BO79DRAFT_288792 [Aspergillus costaricaensis CBS 115574]|uniref:Uncharacterized protein n=1 Tax=Aspergillus costaricaensis CBS 115574 TaxID=1448317 RepID=A0ACD1IAD7_9EURO|nr:hypothetical protein BO79DRAFT_288792 [Aspergillus costaricaensis CBS 115574]RAK86963.1 hypothetical protein BO79DRAFT_288792 [Aspergillus costaricaensis CBS 115574]
MKFTLLPTLTTTTLLFLPTAYTSSLETLRYKNWDLRLFSPGCDPNTTSFELSLFHRQGVSGTADGCETLDSSVNVSAVDTFSWKSPGATTYDLCLYDVCGSSGNGSGRVEVIRDGWEVCVKYWGWLGWGVVEHGGDC